MVSTFQRFNPIHNVPELGLLEVCCVEYTPWYFIQMSGKASRNNIVSALSDTLPLDANGQTFVRLYKQAARLLLCAVLALETVLCACKHTHPDCSTLVNDSLTIAIFKTSSWTFSAHWTSVCCRSQRCSEIPLRRVSTGPLWLQCT